MNTQITSVSTATYLARAEVHVHVRRVNDDIDDSAFVVTFDHDEAHRYIGRLEQLPAQVREILEREPIRANEGWLGGYCGHVEIDVEIVPWTMSDERCTIGAPVIFAADQCSSVRWGKLDQIRGIHVGINTELELRDGGTRWALDGRRRVFLVIAGLPWQPPVSF